MHKKSAYVKSLQNLIIMLQTKLLNFQIYAMLLDSKMIGLGS